jgi:hypothetical protein
LKFHPTPKKALRPDEITLLQTEFFNFSIGRHDVVLKTAFPVWKWQKTVLQTCVFLFEGQCSCPETPAVSFIPFRMAYEKNVFAGIMQKGSVPFRKQWILHRYNTRTRRMDHEHNGYTGRPHAGQNGSVG